YVEEDEVVLAALPGREPLGEGGGGEARSGVVPGGLRLRGEHRGGVRGHRDAERVVAELGPGGGRRGRGPGPQRQLAPPGGEDVEHGDPPEERLAHPGDE